MKRRTLLQWLAALPAALHFQPLRLFAQPRELTPGAIAALHEIAPTVLPSARGAAKVRSVAEKCVALTHGCRHPRLQKSGPSPVPGDVSPRAVLGAEDRAKGARWSALDSDTGRSLLDAALAKPGVRNLPARPSGQHVVANLMAFDGRSSEANDDCDHALIHREVCRPIAIRTRCPEALQ